MSKIKLIIEHSSLPYKTTVDFELDGLGQKDLLKIFEEFIRTSGHPFEGNLKFVIPFDDVAKKAIDDNRPFTFVDIDNHQPNGVLNTIDSILGLEDEIDVASCVNLEPDEKQIKQNMRIEIQQSELKKTKKPVKKASDAVYNDNIYGV
jgi:hypothetical protein